MKLLINSALLSIALAAGAFANVPAASLVTTQKPLAVTAAAVETAAIVWGGFTDDDEYYYGEEQTSKVALPSDTIFTGDSDAVPAAETIASIWDDDLPGAIVWGSVAPKGVVKPVQKSAKVIAVPTDPPPFETLDRPLMASSTHPDFELPCCDAGEATL